MKITRRSILFTALLGSALAGCDQSVSTKPMVPVEIDAHTTCDLDGMLLADYPGPKAQIHYAGHDAPVFFCDTVEMFHTLLAPEQVKAIRAVYVQDMGKADWDQPRGNWIDAKSGFYVLDGADDRQLRTGRRCQKVCRAVGRQAVALCRGQTRDGRPERRRAARQQDVDIFL
jgi:nitrous oxide reductase accessory protein NosL